MSKMNFKEHLANYALGIYGYSYLIQVAIAGLLDGYESEHLAILAGEDEKNFNAHEVNSYFEKALKELNIELPSLEQSLKTVVAYWITQIIKGDIPPLDALSHIIALYRSSEFEIVDSKYAGDALHVENLYGLYYAFDDLNEFSTNKEYARYSREEGPNEIIEEIITEAKKYHEKYIKQ